MAEAASPSSHSSFCEEVFSRRSAHAAARMRWSGQIFWLLACGTRLSAHLLPAFTAGLRLTIGSWEVVSSYSSATIPEIAAAESPRKNYFRLHSTQNRISILSLAARRKGIARYAALHLDCARSA